MNYLRCSPRFSPHLLVGQYYSGGDTIINKTPISYKANRMIGGDAPSAYLFKPQNHDQVQLENDDMDSILAGHFIPTEKLRTDNF
ncbi:hypothetical protein MELB17_03410 [Marinobacter sp. ELB17]|nr:hypothetical protein MELB17_03410 [Marinobacter sp. ELB17]